MIRRGCERLSRLGPRLFFPLLGILAAAVLLVLWSAAQTADGAETPLLHSEVLVLAEGWVDEAGSPVSLPLKLPYRAEGYRFETVLPADYGASECLLFSAKYLNVRLYLDGVELGSCLCGPPGQDRTLGKVFGLFPLPEGSAGATLTLAAEPLLGEGHSYELTAPRVGAGCALVYGRISGELPLLGMNAVIFCFGVFLLLCGVQALFVKAPQSGVQSFQAGFYHIGLFAVLFSLYALSNTDTVHLFLANSYFIYLMEFLLLALLPLPLLALVAENASARYRAVLKALCGALMLNFCVQAVLHLRLGLELRDAVPATHALIVVSAGLLVPALASVSPKSKERLWLFLSFAPILAGALLDVARYYLPGAYQKLAGFQLGVLLFLLMQTIYLLRQILASSRSYLQASVYRQMAYTDALTGLANRTAFEAMLVKVQERPARYASVWCLSADINGLKQANDTLGHAAGDALIRGAAELLRSELDGEHLFRTGGDEFVALLFDRTEGSVRDLCARIRAAADQYGATPSLSIALGCDRLREGDSLARLLSRADARMYEDKRRWKEAQAGGPH